MLNRIVIEIEGPTVRVYGPRMDFFRALGILTAARCSLEQTGGFDGTVADPPVEPVPADADQPFDQVS